MNFVSRLGYVVGVITLGVLAGRLLRAGGSRSTPGSKVPVAELAHRLEEAWAPYHNR